MVPWGPSALFMQDALVLVGFPKIICSVCPYCRCHPPQMSSSRCGVDPGVDRDQVTPCLARSELVQNSAWLYLMSFHQLGSHCPGASSQHRAQTALLCAGVSPASLVSNDGAPQFTSKSQSSSKAIEGHRTWEWHFVFSTSHFIAKFVQHKVNNKLFYCRLEMDFDTGCLLKYQIYYFRYLYLSKFLVEQLCKAPCTGPGHRQGSLCWPWRDLRHLLWTEHKPMRTVLAVCKADLHFWSRESHPKCVLVIFVVCNKVLSVAEGAVQACSPSQPLTVEVRERWDACLPPEQADTIQKLGCQPSALIGISERTNLEQTANNKIWFSFVSHAVYLEGEAGFYWWASGCTSHTRARNL